MVTDIEIYDSSVLIECLDGDVEIINEIIENYFDDMAGRMDELSTAIMAGDSGLVKRGGHTMKGASATIGAKEVSAIAWEIEKAGHAGVIEDAGKKFEELKIGLKRLKSHLGK